MGALQLLCLAGALFAQTEDWEAVPCDEGIGEYERTEEIVAFSEDGRRFVMRSGDTRPACYQNLETGDLRVEDVEIIKLLVYRCGDNQFEPIRSFAITTEQAHTKTRRKREWDKAEKWLLDQKYAFVVGGRAVKTASATAKVGDMVTDKPFARVPIPLALAPAGIATASLEVWIRETTRKTRTAVVSEQDYAVKLVVLRKGDSDPVVRDLKVGLGPYSPAEEPHYTRHALSPDGRCLALHQQGIGAYRKTFDFFRTLYLEEAEKALAEVAGKP